MKQKQLVSAMSLCLLGMCGLDAMAATFQVTNNLDSGNGSLRSAITQANNAAGADTITFAIGTGAQTIALLSQLPAIGNGGLTIDAETQPGFNGAPLIRIDGASAGATADGLVLNGTQIAVRGLVITRFGGQGVRINGNDNVLVGNYIGVGHDGTTALGNGDCGVRIAGSGNYIGGTLGNQRNVISGNANYGVLSAGGFGNNLIMNNRIGTNASGTAAIGNAVGVRIASPGNTIGGDGPQYRNVIAGNLGHGLEVVGNNNKVYANYIGLGLNGSTVIANQSIGVDVSGSGNEIGGIGVKGNTIAGNDGHGVYVQNAATVFVRGNLIGMNVAGTQAAPNQGDGLSIDATLSAVVESNFISGNTGNGVGVRGLTANPEVVELYGNFIGVDASGVAALPNLGRGVALYQMDGQSKIGAVNKANVISGNGDDGINLRECANVSIEANRIGVSLNSGTLIGNAGMGIQVDTGTNIQIGGVLASQGNVVSGNLEGGMGLRDGSSATIRNNKVGLDGSGNAPMGNGGVGIGIGYGANDVSVGTGDGGNVVSANGGVGVSVIEGVVNIVGNRIGTDASGSLPFPNEGGVGVSGAADVLIDSNLISGNHSDAIGVGSTESAVEIIRNKIGTDATGQSAIPNSSAMRVVAAATGSKIGAPGQGNQISGNTRGITLDDTTSGLLIQGNNFGLNVDRTQALGNDEWALSVDGSNHQVGGGADAGNVFAASGSGIQVHGSGHQIQGNRVGTNANGVAGLGNYHGIQVEGASDVLIGGAPGLGNTVVNSTWVGISVVDSLRVRLQGNLVHHNVEYPIDLSPNAGTTLNDALDIDQGPNERQNFPTVMTAAVNGANLQLTGMLDSKRNGSYQVELYHTSACHGSGYGQAETYLGETTVLTDGLGHGTFSTLINNAPVSGFVTAIVTDAAGNTSEFGPCLAMGAANAGQLNFDRYWTMTYEDLGVAAVTITRTNGFQGAISAQFTTANNSAFAGSDYVSTTQTVNFASGESSKVVLVPLISDGPGENMEDFDIHLTNPTGGATLGDLKDARVAIYEQDANNVHGSIEDVSVTEPTSGQVPATFTITIGSNPSLRTINYTTEDATATAGGDYVAISGTLTFQPGETSKTVTVMVRADGNLEDGEYFNLRLSETDSGLSLLREVAVGAIANTGGAMILFSSGFED